MLVKRSIALSGHRTSIALEPEFWAALDAIAAARQQSTVALIRLADESRDPEDALASALRILALRDALTRQTDPA
jgi:predicted DNA-binding ribbon-helix-helix protein